jgi:phage baseplate assembly protein W
MATYIGFSTINANKPRSTNLSTGTGGGTGSVVQPIVYGKKYRMVDEQLVIQDLINALNIPQGQKVGNPGYGTLLQTFLFEPNNLDTQMAIQNEIRRVANSDPRLIINTVNCYPSDNGILLEVELAIAPFNNAQTLSIFFDQATGTGTIR